MINEVHDKISGLNTVYLKAIQAYEISFTEEEKRYVEEEKKHAKEEKKQYIKVTPLSLLVRRIQEHIMTCSTQRHEERAVFATLINQYGTHSDVTSATFILLGALFYRYFRLIEAYKLNLGGYGWAAFFPELSSPLECKLFIAIRKVLLPHGDKFSYAEDSNYFTATTVVSALESFQFVSDKLDLDLMSKLDDLIQEHKKRGAPIYEQLNAITFLTSFSTELVAEYKTVTKELDELLVRQDKNATCVWNPDDHSLSVDTRCIIKRLLTDTRINVDGYTWEKFIEEIKNLYSNQLECTLLGACLLLCHSKDVSPTLIHCIQSVVLDSFRFEDYSEKLLCVKLLQQRYVLNDKSDDAMPSALKFDVTFFGSDALFKTAIMKCSEVLNAHKLPSTISI